MINACFEPEACSNLTDDDIVSTIEAIMKRCAGKEEELTRARCVHLLSKVMKCNKSVLQIAQSKELMVRLFLFMNRRYADLYQNCIRVLHSVLKLRKFASDKCDEFGVNKAAFGGELAEIIKTAIRDNESAVYINAFSLASQACQAFGSDHAICYIETIKPMTGILSDKLGSER